MLKFVKITIIKAQERPILIKNPEKVKMTHRLERVIVRD